jgi:type II secretory pathway component PulM
MNTAAALSTREKIALAVSGAILLATVGYWVVQISDVIATLRLAYGG